MVAAPSRQLRRGCWPAKNCSPADATAERLKPDRIQVPTLIGDVPLATRNIL